MLAAADNVPMIPMEPCPLVDALLKMLEVCKQFVLQHLSEDLHTLGFHSTFSALSQLYSADSL